MMYKVSMSSDNTPIVAHAATLNLNIRTLV
jgi:hypothetical protein